MKYWLQHVYGKPEPADVPPEDDEDVIIRTPGKSMK